MHSTRLRYWPMLALRITLVMVIASVSHSAVRSAFATAPEPSPLPTRWEFDLSVSPLRITTIQGEDGVARSFFYLTYSVTNRTGEDRLLTPLWELTTDHGETLASGRGVPPRVVQTLMKRLDRPLLEDQVQILGTLRQGRANTKHGLVVWPAHDLRIDEVVVYATGFSGESTRITTEDPETGEVKTFVLRKTWMRRHPVPGDLIGIDGRRLEEAQTRWVMR